MRRIVILAAAVATPALAQSIQPGQWQTTSTVSSMNMPGLPPAALAAMKGHPTTVSNCVTPEQAKAGPKELLKSAPSCTFNRFSMAGGRIDSEMVCARGGRTTTATTTGSYTPVSMTATSKVVAEGMTITATVSGKRIGDCK